MVNLVKIVLGIVLGIVSSIITAYSIFYNYNTVLVGGMGFNLPYLSFIETFISSFVLGGIVSLFTYRLTYSESVTSVGGFTPMFFKMVCFRMILALMFLLQGFVLHLFLK